MNNDNGFHIDLGGMFVWYHLDGCEVVIRTPYEDELHWWVENPALIGDSSDGPKNWEWAWRLMT